jgi:hypothetical protein
LPADDGALVGWLIAQPGVTAASVTREGKVLVVTYDSKAGQPMPKVLEQADALGDGGRGSFFGDLRQK